jgi:hypothetical protein
MKASSVDARRSPAIAARFTSVFSRMAHAIFVAAKCGMRRRPVIAGNRVEKSGFFASSSTLSAVRTSCHEIAR